MAGAKRVSTAVVLPEDLLKQVRKELRLRKSQLTLDEALAVLLREGLARINRVIESPCPSPAMKVLASGNKPRVFSKAKSAREWADKLRKKHRGCEFAFGALSGGGYYVAVAWKGCDRGAPLRLMKTVNSYIDQRKGQPDMSYFIEDGDAQLA